MPNKFAQYYAISKSTMMPSSAITIGQLLSKNDTSVEHNTNTLSKCFESILKFAILSRLKSKRDWSAQQSKQKSSLGQSPKAPHFRRIVLGRGATFRWPTLSPVPRKCHFVRNNPLNSRRLSCKFPQPRNGVSGLCVRRHPLLRLGHQSPGDSPHGADTALLHPPRLPIFAP